jgi:hypothetical protein
MILGENKRSWIDDGIKEIKKILSNYSIEFEILNTDDFFQKYESKFHRKPHPYVRDNMTANCKLRAVNYTNILKELRKINISTKKYFIISILITIVHELGHIEKKFNGNCVKDEHCYMHGSIPLYRENDRIKFVHACSEHKWEFFYEIMEKISSL